MIQIVRRKMPVMGTHGKRGNLVQKIAVRVLVNEGELIAVVQEIRKIVGVAGLNLAPLVDDTVVLHLNVGRWLEICSTIFLMLKVIELGAAKDFAQKCMKLKSPFRCRRPQS